MAIFAHKEGATFLVDNKFGLEQEEVILPDLEKYFGEKFVKSENIMSVYDSYNDNRQIEIKSRRNIYAKYSTTLIGRNKAINTNKEQLFVFNFIDSIYYIKYNDELFKSWVSPFCRFTRKNFNDKHKDYFYIPIDKLTLIKKKDYTPPPSFLKGKCLINLNKFK